MTDDVIRRLRLLYHGWDGLSPPHLLLEAAVCLETAERELTRLRRELAGARELAEILARKLARDLYPNMRLQTEDTEAQG